MLLADEQGVQLILEFHVVICGILAQVTRRWLKHFTDGVNVREMLEDLGLENFVECFDPLKEVFIFSGDYWDSLGLSFDPLEF